MKLFHYEKQRLRVWEFTKIMTISEDEIVLMFKQERFIIKGHKLKVAYFDKSEIIIEGDFLCLERESL